MVVRTRLRAILGPLALYAFAGAVCGYFLWHSVNGERGLKATVIAKAQLRAAQGELATLQARNAAWRRKVDSLQPDAIDRDLLEEDARLLLGRVGRDDLIVVMTQ